MIVLCENCGKQFKLSSNILEIVYRCPSCGKVNRVVNKESASANGEHGEEPSPEKRPVFTKARVLVAAAVLVLVAASAFSMKKIMKKEDAPIILGCPLSTGFLYGRDAERGIRLAVEEINSKGGVEVNGTKRPFKVVVRDTHDLEPGVPVSTALATLEKLILEEGADFILGGPVRSEAALSAMDILSQNNKISILSTGVLTPKYHALVEKEYARYKNCFRITGEAKWMVKEIIACLEDIRKSYGLNRMHLMLQDVSHSRAGGGIIGKIAQNMGWTITGRVVYPTGAHDFKRGLKKASEMGAQVLLIWMDMPESAVLLKQWYDMKIPALPFGSIISAAEEPGFWEKMGGKGEYCLANVVNAGNAPSKATQWTMSFYKAYAAKWGVEPEGYGSSSSYMAPYVLKNAIERAGSLETGKVIKALEKTNMMGVYGKIKFDPKNHQIIPSFDPQQGAVGSIFQWQDGKRVVVFPRTIAMGKIKLPPAMKVEGS